MLISRDDLKNKLMCLKEENNIYQIISEKESEEGDDDEKYIYQVELESESVKVDQPKDGVITLMQTQVSGRIAVASSVDNFWFGTQSIDDLMNLI